VLDSLRDDDSINNQNINIAQLGDGKLEKSFTSAEAKYSRLGSSVKGKQMLINTKNDQKPNNSSTQVMAHSDLKNGLHQKYYIEKNSQVRRVKVSKPDSSPRNGQKRS